MLTHSVVSAVEGCGDWMVQIQRYFTLLPAIRFHILTPFLVVTLVVLTPIRGTIQNFEKNAEDFRIFFKKFFEQQNTPVRKARTGV